jgi:hypothetical protein
MYGEALHDPTMKSPISCFCQSSRQGEWRSRVPKLANGCSAAASPHLPGVIRCASTMLTRVEEVQGQEQERRFQLLPPCQCPAPDIRLQPKTRFFLDLIQLPSSSRVRVERQATHAFPAKVLTQSLRRWRTETMPITATRKLLCHSRSRWRTTSRRSA